jgi:hypothetical protein
MAARITPHLIELAYDAALTSFWRKEALRQFLRGCHLPSNLLATWASEESKRDFLDRVFENLQKTDSGKAAINQMAAFLADQMSFPDLRNWEDSDLKIAQAKASVAQLREYLKKQDEEITSEREREQAKVRTRKEREKVQRAQTDKAKLEERLGILHTSVGTQQGGYDFQDWFYDLLDFSEIVNRRPYVSNGRQIDGSLNVDGTTYLVELKFTATQADATDVDSFKAKVESKADNTMGVMVSISGYSSVAISEASGKKTPLLLLDSSHIYLFLTASLKFADIVSRVRRHAAQTGEAHLPAAKFSG